NLLPTDVEFHLTSAEHMSAIGDSTIDVVFSSNFLEHLPSKAAVDRVLDEIRRVLRSGGFYIALQPNIRFCYDRYWDFYDHHVALSDRSCKEAFIQAGLDVVTLIPRFLPFTTKSHLPTHPALVRIYLAFPWLWHFLGEQFLIVGTKK
ncbi:MAG TPA: methyltransferase domain-containing protein, partial [Isosphaeraceae bacterium]|nr:methyltransferase domain-containing protein [Isosphaeraceae bacterium]